jgi:hypothetical protein
VDSHDVRSIRIYGGVRIAFGVAAMTHFNLTNLGGRTMLEIIPDDYKLKDLGTYSVVMTDKDLELLGAMLGAHLAKKGYEDIEGRIQNLNAKYDYMYDCFERHNRILDEMRNLSKHQTPIINQADVTANHLDLHLKNHNKMEGVEQQMTNKREIETQKQDIISLYRDVESLKVYQKKILNTLRSI